MDVLIYNTLIMCCLLLNVGSKGGVMQTYAFIEEKCTSLSTPTPLSPTRQWALLRRAIHSKVVVTNPFGGVDC